MVRTIVTATALWTLLGISAETMAQDGASVTIQRDDSGATHVRHVSMPNLEALRTPAFTRKDLPIFAERLVLSDAQGEVIGQRIDAYIEEFLTLTKDLASVAGPAAEMIASDDSATDAESQRPPRGAAAIGLPGGRRNGPGVAFDDLESQLPPGSQVGVSMMIGIDGGQSGGDGTASPAPAPSAQVDVSIETPGGEEVPPELLAKFQERADELAATVLDDLRAQEEARAAGEPDVPAGPGVLMTSPEELEAHQAALTAKIEQFLQAKARLRDTFVTDAQSTLSTEQVERWPSLERALTRERSLPRGRISGESTDLIKVLAGQKLPESSMEAAAPELEAYEMELDGALKRRDAFLADVNDAIDAAISANDPDKAISLAEKAADLRVAVRRINQRFAEQIALALGAGTDDAFRSAALRAFYPRIYNPTRGQKMFDAIDDLDGVPSDVAAAIAEMRASYTSELASLNEQIRQVIDREEPRERVRGLEQLRRTIQGDHGGHGGHGEAPMVSRSEDPIREAIERRAELDDRYLKTVASLLPEALSGALPKPRVHKGPIVVRSGNR